MCETTIGCNESGVWREDHPGTKMLLSWDEITRVSAYKLDCITQIDTVLEFDHESGHYLEFNDSWSGFNDVVNGINEHLESLSAEWVDSMEALKAGDDPIIVWQRDDYPES